MGTHNLHGYGILRSQGSAGDVKKQRFCPFVRWGFVPFVPNKPHDCWYYTRKD